jgi:hypothetical protein
MEVFLITILCLWNQLASIGAGSPTSTQDSMTEARFKELIKEYLAAEKRIEAPLLGITSARERFEVSEREKLYEQARSLADVFGGRALDLVQTEKENADLYVALLVQMARYFPDTGPGDVAIKVLEDQFSSHARYEGFLALMARRASSRGEAVLRKAVKEAKGQERKTVGNRSPEIGKTGAAARGPSC